MGHRILAPWSKPHFLTALLLSICRVIGEAFMWMYLTACQTNSLAMRLQHLSTVAILILASNIHVVGTCTQHKLTPT